MTIAEGTHPFPSRTRSLSPPARLCIQRVVSRHHSGRVAPFGYSGLVARMQLPLNVSPVSASFIGLQRLGIHLVLSLACVCWYPSCSCWLTCYCACERCHLAPLLSSQGGPGTHTSRSSASLLSSCLGNIEVIVIYFCYAVVNVQVSGTPTPEKWKPASQQLAL